MEGSWSWYLIVAYFSFCVLSLLPRCLVHFFLILFCFIVCNLFSMFLLYCFLQRSLGHISSGTCEQCFCVTL